MSEPIIKDQPALLRLRQRLENVPKQINNNELPAGSPMYFYCKICGHQSDVKSENYISSPTRYCAECRDLRQANPQITDKTIIELAKAAT